MKVGKHATLQVALRVLSDLLRDRDDPHTGSLQLAAMMLQQALIAEGDAVH